MTAAALFVFWAQLLLAQAPEADPGVRPVGAVETLLADKRATVDFIADGVHVHPAAIRAAVAAKGWERVLLITDSNDVRPGITKTAS